MGAWVGIASGLEEVEVPLPAVQQTAEPDKKGGGPGGWVSKPSGILAVQSWME